MSLQQIGSNVKKGVKLIGQVGKAFVRNATGGDVKKLDQSWNKKRQITSDGYMKTK